MHENLQYEFILPCRIQPGFESDEYHHNAELSGGAYQHMFCLVYHVWEPGVLTHQRAHLPDARPHQVDWESDGIILPG